MSRRNVWTNIRRVPALLLLAVLLSQRLSSGQELRFHTMTLDENVGRVCYAVTVADVDGDGDEDLVALTESRVIWYEQPDWNPHVILKDQTPPDNVCIAAHDIDRDGRVDFAIGAGWTKTGTLHWIHRPESEDGLWTVSAIGEEASVHRMRWADVLGRGTPQLVVSPLNASVGSGVRLLAFEIPSSPATERWPATVMNAELNRLHNHWHADLDDDETVDTITASREGVLLVRRDGDQWQSVKLSDGMTGAADPNLNGAGEVRVGRLKSGRRFLVTVEPMHGDHLTVCLEPEEAPSAARMNQWPRTVIDSGFQRGHALGIGDFDGDGSEDIAFGHSDTPGAFGVRVYLSTGGTGSTWKRIIVDEGGMATEDLVVADLTGDGKPDIAAGGRATHNVRLYVNQGP